VLTLFDYRPRLSSDNILLTPSAKANSKGLEPQYACSSPCGDGHTPDAQGNCVDVNECESECKDENMVRITDILFVANNV